MNGVSWEEKTREFERICERITNKINVRRREINSPFQTKISSSINKFLFITVDGWKGGNISKVLKIIYYLIMIIYIQEIIYKKGKGTIFKETSYTKLQLNRIW